MDELAIRADERTKVLQESLQRASVGQSDLELGIRADERERVAAGIRDRCLREHGVRGIVHGELRAVVCIACDEAIRIAVLVPNPVSPCEAEFDRRSQRPGQSFPGHCWSCHDGFDEGYDMCESENGEPVCCAALRARS